MTIGSSLESFVPASVARLAAVSPTLLGRGFAERHMGAALFADISGFTALSERLGEHGRAGPDELTEILNSYFASFVAEVVAHGGEVIKFAGDALMATWDADILGSPAAAASAAKAAAGGMQQVVANLDRDGASAIALKVGIGVGEIESYVIGIGAGRLEFVLAGEAVVEATDAEHEAQRGEVRLSTRALALATGERPVLREAGGQAPAADASLLHPFVVPAITTRFEAGHDAWLNELRSVSVVFVGIAGLPTGNDFGAALDTVSDACGDAVAGFGGTVNKVAVDDKGVTLLAVFGLPPDVHEDDPARAVRAAIEVRLRAGGLGATASIGVATGHAFCGVVGGEARREYTVIGDVVNLAARLMQVPSDGILCDGPTTAAAAARLAFQSLGSVALKGKAAPVPVHAPASLGTVVAPAGRRAPVGRQKEREALLTLLPGSVPAPARLAVLSGEAGQGKTHLLAELTARASEMGLTVCEGQAEATEAATPYFALRTVVEQVLGLGGTPSGDVASRRSLALAQIEDDDELAANAPLLNAVLSLEIPETARTRDMTGATRAHLVTRLIRRLIERAAGDAELLTIVDDVQWLDGSSWRVLSELAVAHRVILVVATRPSDGAEPEDLARLRAAPSCLSLRLEGMDDEGLREMAHRRLGGSLDPGLVSFLHGRTGGNPFFFDELLLTLQSRDLLVERGGSFGPISPMYELESVELPRTVEAAITSRLALLSEPHQLTVKVASAIGRSFAVRLLHDIHPIASARPALDAHLAALSERHIAEQEASEPVLTFAFRHALTRDVAYSLLPATQRRLLHREVAAWLESRYASDLSPYLGLLAHHWERAGEHAKAIARLQAAGALSVAQGAYQEAVVLLTRAFELAAGEHIEIRLDDRAAMERQLGEAHYGLGHMAEARAHLVRSLEARGLGRPTGGVPLVVSLSREGTRQAWHRIMGRPRLAALASWRSDSQVDEAILAYERLAELDLIWLDLPQVFDSVLRMLNRAERSGSAVTLARSYAAAATPAGALSLGRLARFYQRRALDATALAGSLSGEAWVHQCISYARLCSGDFDSATAHAEAALTIWRDLANRRAEDEASFFLCLAAYRRGEVTLAAERYAALAASASARGDEHFTFLGLTFGALALVRTGQPAEALSLLDRAAASLNDDERRGGGADLWHAIRAFALIRNGESDAAGEHVRQAASLGGLRTPPLLWLYEGLTARGEAALALASIPGEGAREWRKFARAACRGLAVHARILPSSRVGADLYEARRLTIDGARGRAIRRFHRGIRLAERSGQRLENALMRTDLAALLPDGPERTRHLDRARDLLRECGAEPSVHAQRAAGEETG